jgi:hypothetical protein
LAVTADNDSILSVAGDPWPSFGVEYIDNIPGSES